MSVFMAYNKYHGTQWLGHIILLLHEKLAYTPSEKDHLIAILHPCRMMVLLMAIQIFLIMQVEAGIHLPLALHLLSFVMFFTPSWNLFLGRRNKAVSIHDILKKSRVQLKNLDEGQYQESHANVYS